MSKNKKLSIYILIEIFTSTILMVCCINNIPLMMFFIVLIVVGFIYLIILQNKVQKEEDNVPLTTDMEIFVAGLELRPKKNKEIKNLAVYLEKRIMPNEEILAAPSLAGLAYAILTDKRVILKDSLREFITPIEKINNVVRNYRTI